MRDLIITAIVLGSLPLIFWRPHIGALMWVWLGMMNPHLLTFGFARSFPFAAIVAGTTMLALLFTKKKHSFPVTPVTTLLLLFFFWMCLTRMFALNTDDVVNEMWGRVFKIHLMLWVTLLLIDGRKQIDQLIWAIVISIGYYGLKGGVFTALTGGGSRVWGPQGSFIGGNNELALALVVLIPLMFYLYMTSARKYVRYALIFCMCCCAVAVLGSHSRGALLGIAGMTTFLIFKSANPVRPLVIVSIITAFAFTYMPENWWTRMETIATYDEDSSALARLNTWRMIWSLALDRPIVGAGFDLANPLLYQLYAERKEVSAHAAHSIYFQALGEHGFVGLAIYLALAIGTWVTAGRVATKAINLEQAKWVPLLMRMVQVSMIGFGVGGAFLGLLHFDLPYYLIVLVILAQRHVLTMGKAVGQITATG